jgi:hypothetical protein
MDKPAEGAPGWLVMVAQLPTEDPAARMRVLRTLESLGAAVIREGAYLLPDSPANRQSLESLVEYVSRTAGASHVLHVTASSPVQAKHFMQLFDRTQRYESLIKTIESLRVGFGQTDPGGISRVLHKQRREFEAIAALDFFARARCRRSSMPTRPCGTCSSPRPRPAPCSRRRRSCAGAPGRRESRSGRTGSPARG